MPRRITRPALTLLIMGALLCAILFQGRRFLWCPVMLEARETCCCPARERDQPGPAVERPACCDPRLVPGAADASAPSERTLPLAVIAATIDTVGVTGDRSHVTERSATPRTWGASGAPLPPRGPPYALNCRYLI